MISLDQIQKLESRVSRAVELITSLRKENASLSSGLDAYRKRIDEMEVLIGKFKEDQNAIEHGVMSALEQLDRLEDGLTPEEKIPEERPDSSPLSGTENEEAEINASTAPTAVATDEEPDSELDIF